MKMIFTQNHKQTYLTTEFITKQNSNIYCYSYQMMTQKLTYVTRFFYSTFAKNSIEIGIRLDFQKSKFTFIDLARTSDFM